MLYRRTLISLAIITVLSFLPWMSYAQDSYQASLDHIQTEYGRLKYIENDADKKISGIQSLRRYTADLHAQHPQAIEPFIWYGLISATEADFLNNRSALPILDKARDILTQAVEDNPKAMDGIAPTSLGALYFQAPGWPISFGDNGKARTYLNMALEIAPDSIDTNYFYGKYLVERRRYSDAIPYFKKGLQAKPRKGLEIADQGRLQELEHALKSAKAYARHE